MMQAEKKLMLLVIGTWILGNIAIIFMLPSLPSIALDLHTTTTLAKYTISIFLLGKATGMLVYGPLSEKFGRRLFVLIGLSLYFLGSVFSSLAPTIYILLGSRLIQGLGTSATILMGRVIINDKFKHNHAARVFSYLFLITSILIGCLPVLGGFVTHYFKWRSIFIVMSIYSGSFFILCFLFLEESLLSFSTERFSLKKTFSHYKTIFSNKLFLAYVLCSGFMVAGESAFNTASPFLLMKTVGVSTQRYGVLMTLLELGHLVGTLLCGWSVKKYHLSTLMTIGVSILAFSSCSMVIFILSDYPSLWVIITSMILFYVGTGFVLTIATVGVVTPFPNLIGVSLAASLLLYFSFSAVSSAVISIIPTTSFEISSMLIGGYGVLALLSWLYFSFSKTESNYPAAHYFHK